MSVEREGRPDVGIERIGIALMTTDTLAKTRHEVIEERRQELGLVVEMMMHEARRDARLGGDGGNRSAGVAMIGENTSEGAEKLLAPRRPIAWSSHNRLVV